MSLNLKAVATVFALAVPFASPAMADTWTVDHDQSSLGFEVARGDNTLTGEFQDWTSSIDFDPEAPEEALITTEINTASAVTGNAQYDGMLPSDDWFAVSEFAAADFTTDNVMALENGAYKADGFLTIKAITLPIELNFTLEIDGDTAHAVGTATLDRTEYDLGPSVDAETVGDVVTVNLDLTATR